MLDLVGLILNSQSGKFSKSTWKSILGVAVGVILMLFITSKLDSFIINMEDYMLNFLPEIQFQRTKNSFPSQLKFSDAQELKLLLDSEEDILVSGPAFVYTDILQIATDTTCINKRCFLFSGLIPEMHDGKFIDANLLLNIKPYLQLNEALKNIFVNDSNKVIISRKLQLKLFGNNSAIGRQINIGLLKTDKSKLTPVTIAGIYNNNSVNAIFVSRSIATSITGNNRALWANSYIVRLKDKYFSKDWRKKLRDENIKLRDEAKFKLAKLYDKTSEAYKKLENQLQKAESNLNFLRPFQIQSWMDVSPENLEYLKITRAIMLVVFISILILSGLSIKFLFDTIVIEKKRQISILKTLGYSDLSILNAFIMSGAFIGFTGVLIGIALGYTLNWTTGLLEQQYFEQSFFFQYRSILPSLTFTGKVIILVMVLCMASALPSALRVMKTRPIEGIRRDN